MAEVVGFLWGQNGPQVVFHLFRGGVLRQPQAAGNADAVGVRHHGGLVVDVPHNEVGGFPPYAGQPCQLLDGVRHLAAELVPNHQAYAQNVLGLGVVKPAGANQLPNLLHRALAKGLQGGEAGEQRRGDQVHPGVGALGGKPCGDKQLQGVLVLQGAHGPGVLRLKGFHRQLGPFFFRHGKRSFPWFRFPSIVPCFPPAGKMCICRWGFFAAEGFSQGAAFPIAIPALFLYNEEKRRGLLPGITREKGSRMPCSTI